ncbi:hypothetical protein ACJX0J_015400 [Zea mays]
MLNHHLIVLNQYLLIFIELFYSPHFKGDIGAIDGSHVKVHICVPYKGSISTCLETRIFAIYFIIFSYFLSSQKTLYHTNHIKSIASGHFFSIFRNTDNKNCAGGFRNVLVKLIIRNLSFTSMNTIIS